MKSILLPFLMFAMALPSFVQAQSCSSTNIAVGKPVVVSSEWIYRPSSGAVDGNMGTSWYTLASGDAHYIYVDLLQSYTVCKVKLYWETDGRGKNYEIQTSTDATNWTTIATRTNNNAVIDSFDLIGNGRYIRLNLTAKVNTWSGYTLQEFEIYNTLSNSKPQVSLTAPANNFSAIGGSNLKVTATAHDVDGSISKVEFYEGENKIGEALSAPYEFLWMNLQPGNYTLYAKAFDNTNADSLSLPVNVTVTPSSRWLLTGNPATDPATNFIGTTDSKRLVFKVNNSKKLSILTNGFVGIGVDTLADQEAKLGVNGSIYARKLKINQSSWADYVFEKEYPLMSLPSLEAYIQKNKHLPDVPTAKETGEKGTDVADVQALLLRKIEELTLYIIAQDKKIAALQHNTVKRRSKKGNRN